MYSIKVIYYVCAQPIRKLNRKYVLVPDHLHEEERESTIRERERERERARERGVDLQTGVCQ